MKGFFLLHKVKILEEISIERKNLLQYLAEIDFLRDNEKLMVDVGWGCSSQRFLESIIQDKVHAIYFGTHKETYSHELMHGYIFNKGFPEKENNLVLSALPVVELLFTGDHYSVVKIDNNGCPVFHCQSKLEDERIEIATFIHNGARNFVNDYQNILTKYKVRYKS